MKAAVIARLGIDQVGFQFDEVSIRHLTLPVGLSPLLPSLPTSFGRECNDVTQAMRNTSLCRRLGRDSFVCLMWRKSHQQGNGEESSASENLILIFYLCCNNIMSQSQLSVVDTESQFSHSNSHIQSETSLTRSEGWSCTAAAITGLVLMIVAITVLVFFVGGVVDLSSDDKSNPKGQSIPKGLRSFNWCGQRKRIALMISDSPTPNKTPQLLKDLKRLDIKASFFLSPATNGDVTDAQCDLVKTILDEGHQIHSQSYAKTDYLTLTMDEIYNDLSTWKKWVLKCADGRPTGPFQLLPPFGNLNTEYATKISEDGFVVASWTIDSADWRRDDVQKTFSSIVNDFQSAVPADGSATILLHEFAYDNGGSEGILDLLVPYFSQKGYEFVDTQKCYDDCVNDPNVSGQVCRLANRWPGTFDDNGVLPTI